jgi:hypothetical protein
LPESTDSLSFSGRDMCQVELRSASKHRAAEFHRKPSRIDGSISGRLEIRGAMHDIPAVRFRDSHERLNRLLAR